MNQPVINTEESDIERLRRIVSCLDNCNGNAIDSYKIVNLIFLVEACWASDWYVYPDQLPQALRDKAAKHGPTTLMVKMINSWCEKNL